MFKKQMTSLIFLILSSGVYSQTYDQQSLVDRFMGNRAMRIIAQLAHPMSSEQSYSVTHSGHTYYLSINYKYGNEYFTCTHWFELNETGQPRGYGVYNCGATGWWKCFEGLDFWKSIFTTLTEDEKDKITHYLGKVLDNLSIKEFCFGRMYYYWVNDGYYKNY